MDKEILNSIEENEIGMEKIANELKNLHALFDAPNTFLFKEFESFIMLCAGRNIEYSSNLFSDMSDSLCNTLLNPCYFSENDYFEPPKEVVIKNDQNGEIKQIDLNEEMNNAKSFEEIDHYLKIAEEQNIPIRGEYKDAVLFIKSVKEFEKSLGKESPIHLASVIKLLHCFYSFISDCFYINYKYIKDIPYRKGVYKRKMTKYKKLEEFIIYFNKVKDKAINRNCGLVPASMDVYNSCKTEEKFQKLFEKYYKIDIRKDDDKIQKKAKRLFYFLVRDVNNMKVAEVGVGIRGKVPQKRAGRSEISKKKTGKAMRERHKNQNKES